MYVFIYTHIMGVILLENPTFDHMVLIRVYF